MKSLGAIVTLGENRKLCLLCEKQARELRGCSYCFHQIDAEKHIEGFGEPHQDMFGAWSFAGIGTVQEDRAIALSWVL